MTYSDQRNTIIRPDDLALMLSWAERAPSGLFVEVGVYRGGSARKLYEIAERQGRQLWLFDTFAGHPSPSEHDAPQHPGGRYADCADPAALQQEMPNALVTVGEFGHTTSIVGVDMIAFAHVDVDLYESTLAAIEALAPAIVLDGTIYFDDYGVPECAGATKAINEWWTENDRDWRLTVFLNGKAMVERIA